MSFYTSPRWSVWDKGGLEAGGRLPLATLRNVMAGDEPFRIIRYISNFVCFQLFSQARDASAKESTGWGWCEVSHSASATWWGGADPVHMQN